MKKIIFFLLTAVAAFSSCKKEEEFVLPTNLEVKVESTAENVRATALFSNNDPKFYYPCQLMVDGAVYDKMNASQTVIMNWSNYGFKLPYLTPGTHTLTFVVGKGRTSYTAAEAAWGEKEKVLTANLTVTASSTVTFVFKNPDVDVDYLYVVPAVPYSSDKKNRQSIAAGIHTFSVFPFSLNGAFTIENVSQYVTVTKTTTKVGPGLSIVLTGANPDNVDATFDLVADGVRKTFKAI